jgi:hypothetical protein
MVAMEARDRAGKSDPATNRSSLLPELPGLLAKEADALERVARLLQLVVPPDREEDELLDPVVLLGEALELFACMGPRAELVSGYGSHTEGEADPEVIPPVRTRPSAFRGALLAALDQAQETLARRGDAGGEDPGVIWLRKVPIEGLALEVHPGNGSPLVRIPLPPVSPIAPGQSAAAEPPSGSGGRSEPRI